MIDPTAGTGGFNLANPPYLAATFFEKLLQQGLVKNSLCLKMA
jgi:hypothetical protein